MKLLRARRDLPTDERDRQFAALVADLARAREDAVEIYRDVRTLSRAFRLAVVENHKPVALNAVQSWINDSEALLLYYFLGQEGAFVFVVSAQKEPQFVRLTLDDETAAQLGVESGPRASQQLSGALRVEIMETLMVLSDSRQSLMAAGRLERLWRVLIPEAERKSLVDGAFKRLIVVPDGAVALLPFETLVVEAGENPKYLLDVGPPVLYGPSITVLYNLARRPLSQTGERKPVLTVGDPIYRLASVEVASNDQSVLAQMTVTSRYLALGGELAPLPYSGLESSWVADVFLKQGIAAGMLKKEDATEAAVRSNMPGRRVVHLACHGFVDQTHGNLFGALAFAPGKKGLRTRPTTAFSPWAKSTGSIWRVANWRS